MFPSAVWLHAVTCGYNMWLRVVTRLPDECERELLVPVGDVLAVDADEGELELSLAQRDGVRAVLDALEDHREVGAVHLREAVTRGGYARWLREAVTLEDHREVGAVHLRGGEAVTRSGYARW